ncbi:MAG: hypothetical protein HYX24_04860 [Candidatus Aenigmarchaeota archaeon]|nr:hypothetical protein [Candidatus Aenigmarchaeota archaeon]
MENENVTSSEVVLLALSGVIVGFLVKLSTIKIFGKLVSEPLYGIIAYTILMLFLVVKGIPIAYLQLYKIARNMNIAVFQNPIISDDIYLVATSVFISLIITDIFNLLNSLGLVFSTVLTIGISVLLFFIVWKIIEKTVRIP